MTTSIRPYLSVSCRILGCPPFYTYSKLGEQPQSARHHPTLLIYPNRYRLMLRRVLQKKMPRFGMIMYPSQEGAIVSYGTMLEVRSVRILGDGRSIVETWGSYRFRIVKRGEQDGYMVSKIDR